MNRFFLLLNKMPPQSLYTFTIHPGIKKKPWGVTLEDHMITNKVAVKCHLKTPLPVHDLGFINTRGEGKGEMKRQEGKKKPWPLYSLNLVHRLIGRTASCLHVPCWHVWRSWTCRRPWTCSRSPRRHRASASSYRGSCWHLRGRG